VSRAFAAAALAAAACGDNTRVVDAAVEGSPDMPDLALVAAQMDGTELIQDATFTATDCEVVEGCVGDVGTRRLLRFSTVTANLGSADLVLGATPPPGVSAGLFVWSPCHMHHHVAGYADFSLWNGADLVVAGRKQAFCLEDDTQVVPGGPSHGYRCNYQGMTVGWADVYGRELPCQWIDVTGVASGTYTLRVEIDATGVLPDRDPTNNTWVNQVDL
jgi:lysyl oxidase